MTYGGLAFHYGGNSGHFTILQYSTVYYSTVQNSTVQYSTVQYSTSKYIAVHYRGHLYRTRSVSGFISLELNKPWMQGGRGRGRGRLGKGKGKPENEWDAPKEISLPSHVCLLRLCHCCDDVLNSETE